MPAGEYGLDVLLGNQAPGTSANLSTALSAGYIGSPQGGQETLEALFGTFTYVSPSFSLGTIAGAKALGYEDDWYYRIHVIPTSIDVGNLIDPQVRTFEVWNAYFSQKTLGSIVVTGGQGITLNRPGAAPSEPATYDPLEILTYSLAITLNGPARISATYEFIFADDSPQLLVVGDRVVLFPFSAEAPVTEILEWRTDVHESYDGHEKRVQARVLPRQEFAMAYFSSSAQEIANRRNAILGTLGHLFGVPAWQETRPLLANGSIGNTSISVDTTNADFRPGLYVLWRSYLDYEVVEVPDGGIAAGSLTIALPLGMNHQAGLTHVVPIRLCYMTDSSRLSAARKNGSTLNAEWRCVDFYDWTESDGALTLYQGKPVILDANFVDRDLPEYFKSGAVELDPGTASFSYVARRDVPEFGTVKTWHFETAADSFKLRRLLYALRGRQRSFWMPTFREDFVLAANIGSSDTQLTVLPVEYGRFVSEQPPFNYILIQLADGTNFFRQITAHGESSGNETITIDSALGQAVNTGDVLRISFLVLSRLGSDRVTITHRRLGAVSVSVPVIGVLQ